MSALWQGAGLVRRLLVLVVLSALSGVLIAGIALPVAAGVGVIAKSGTEKFEDLPTEFGDPTLATTTTFYANDNTPIARFFEQDRSYVKLGQISPYMRNAQLAIEDARFYEHGGADLRGMLRAAVNNASGGGTQGASTLTQQYVKLSLVYQARADDDEKAEKEATEETLNRKLRELRYAIALEEKYTKDQILERYLNIAYYGAGAYGVQAAAQRYFRVSAKKLTLAQAALLAGLVQRPNATDPLNHPQAAEIRRNVVLQRMAETPIGGLTQEQADAAKKVKVKTNVRVPKQECTTAIEDFKWFCDYAKNAFLKDKSFGRTLEDRQDRLYRGGLRVMTTLDPVMQEAAQKGVLKWVDPTDEAAGVVTLVEPGTGYVKGIAISRLYGPDKRKGQSQVNLALNESLGGSIGTQAGSTFKAFVAAAALMKGRGFRYSIYAPGKLKKVTPVKTCDPDRPAIDAGYAPQNESLSENGVYDLQRALRNSINTYFIQLEEDIGICEAATLAKAMGLQKADTGKDLDQFQSFTLGTNNVAPLDMAAAYATFAARGKFCPAYPFTAWYDKNGKKKPLTYKPQCKQVLDTDVADAMNYLLRGVVTGGSGARANLRGIDVAGKTGTTNSRYQAWFMGYTTGLAGSATVWDPKKSGYTLSGKVIGGTRYGTVQGANLPAPMWHDTVGAAIEAGNVDNEDFVTPKGKFYGGGQYSPSFSAGNGYRKYDPKDKNHDGKPDEPAPGDTNGDGKVDTPAPGAKPGSSPSAKPTKPAKPGR